MVKIPSRDASTSLAAYTGNSLKKWVTPLNVPSTGSESIITTVSDAVYAGEVFSTIRNLVKGKKYKVTYSVSTTSLNEAGISSPYAGEVCLFIQYTKPTNQANLC